MSTKKQEQFKAEWIPTGTPDSITLLGGTEYKEFRPWQADCYTRLVGHDLRIINVPTGAGKSHAIKALGLHDQADGKKIIIAVPYRNIAKGFIDEDFLVLPDLGESDFVVPTNWDLVSRAHKVDSGPLVDRAIGFLKTERGDRTLICTHMTLVALYKRLVEEDELDLLDNTSTFIDEAHHIKHHKGESAEHDSTVNGIGSFVESLLAASGIRLTLVTATFFRGDRLSVLPTGVEEQFDRYNLPYDQYLKQLKYLRSIRFNVILYDDSPAAAIRRDLQNSMDKTVDHPIKTVVYIPSVATTYYEERKTDKFAEAKSILQAATRATWNPLCDDNHLLSATTKKGELIAVNLVDDNTSRDKASDYIAENSKDWENGPDLIVSLNMFKEGSDYPLASRGYVVGHRGSLNDIIQMLGRLLRDIEGKEEVEFSLVLPANRIKDGFKEDANTYLNAMILSMLLEDVLAPPSLTNNRKDGERRGSSLSEAVDGDIEEVQNIFNEVFEAAVSSDKDGFENEDIIEILADHGIEECYFEDVINELKRKVAGRLAAQKAWKTIKLSQGLDCGDIDIELMTAEDFAEGVRYLLSDAIGEEAFEQYRNYIIVNSDKYSEAQDIAMTRLVIAFHKENGRYPSAAGKDKEEARLGYWLQKMRAANR